MRYIRLCTSSFLALSDSGCRSTLELSGHLLVSVAISIQSSSSLLAMKQVQMSSFAGSMKEILEVHQTVMPAMEGREDKWELSRKPGRMLASTPWSSLWTEIAMHPEGHLPTCVSAPTPPVSALLIQKIHPSCNSLQLKPGLCLTDPKVICLLHFHLSTMMRVWRNGRRGKGKMEASDFHDKLIWIWLKAP